MAAMTDIYELGRFPIGNGASCPLSGQMFILSPDHAGG